MTKRIKILCLLLVLILILPSVFGCFNLKNGNDSDTQSDTSETQGKATETTHPGTTNDDTQPDENDGVSVKINGINLSDYTIVYERKAIVGAQKAADYLNQRLNELYGTTLESVSKSQDRPEIILGFDGDDAAIAAAYEEHPSGLIGTTGKKVVLLGANYSAICKLIDAFLEKATVGEENTVSISVSGLEFPDTKMDSLKFMSYNILGNMDLEERPRDAREQMVATVLENDIDVLGTQEDNPENYAVFMELLGNYSSYRGVAEKDNGNHIYWKTDKFNLIKKGYYWLSDTPATKSKYDDSTQYRTMSYVILEVKETGKQILFVDVHLDYRASEATRIKQINVLASLVKKVNKDNLPVIILGDFNTLPTNNSGAITKFLNSNPEFVLTSKIAEKKGDTGETLVHQETFTGRYLGAYDNIFVSFDNVYTKYYTVVDNAKDGKYPSDHVPVMVELNIY